MFMHTNHKEI